MFYFLLSLFSLAICLSRQVSSEATSEDNNVNIWTGWDAKQDDNDLFEIMVIYDAILFDIVYRCCVDNRESEHKVMLNACSLVVFGQSAYNMTGTRPFVVYNEMFNGIYDDLFMSN